MQRVIVKVNHVSASLKSKRTEELYAYHMKLFMGTNPPSDNEALTEHIEGYLEGMKQSGLSSSSCNQAYFAIRHYYTHKPNKKSLEWDDIKDLLGANNHTGHKKSYTPEQVKKLLDVGNETDKAKIGCLLSGMRREAMCDIKLEDIKPIPEHGIYEIRIYPNTDSEQIAFTTPEATKWIQAYRDKINPDYWLFPARQVIDSKTGQVKPHLKGKQVNPKSVTTHFIRLSQYAGLRVAKKDGTLTEKAQHREDISAVHGLRHFARNAYKKARIPEENRKLLMGHSIGEVQKAYDDTLTDEELHSQLLQDFLSSVKYLTIDQSLELQSENTELKKKTDEITQLRQQVELLTASHKQADARFAELTDLFMKNMVNQMPEKEFLARMGVGTDKKEPQEKAKEEV
jgi:site-specific recombinase XerD